ncbi:MAG: lysophospholipid acyltransferase family protein [Verrucomicrobiota bacterium]|nr:1-acyl-sn-glycerol-3-phosphate acyltransferase [Limisphaera sp.]MDW8381652.1 lysophospholipid acyltransferase family protein [Verrucomicrobiota bacterium]
MVEWGWTRASGPLSAQQRALWLMRLCRRSLKLLGVSVDLRGPRPSPGYVVSNHLSYLDIVVLGAMTPCVFVAKREVRSWPVLGWLARMAGTIFVDRACRLDVARVVRAMEACRAAGLCVVLFPEGTSSDGRTILRLRSSLLEPLTNEPRCTVAHLRYQADDCDVARTVCYWGDATLMPHLLRLLGLSHIRALVHTCEVCIEHANRKRLAMRLHGFLEALAGRA